MKRVWALVFVLATLSCGTGAFAQSSERLARYAPADEYFGPLKMSILGMRNQLADMSRSYDTAPDDADAIMGKAFMTETSMRDWERKYPRDPALPRYVYALCKLYQKIDLDWARVRSGQVRLWLFSRYAGTAYAKDELQSTATVQTAASAAEEEPSAVK